MTMSSTNPNITIRKSSDTGRRWRDFALLAGLFVAATFGLLGLAAATGWEETLAQISKLSWVHIAALLGFSLINYGIRAFRWHIFTRRLKIGTGFWQDVRHFLGGFALIATPGRVGELVRMRWIRRETGRSFEKSAPLVLIDRASDLSSMAVILGIAAALSNTTLIGAVPVSILALIGAFVVTRPRLLLGIIDTGYRLARRWPRLFARARTSARALNNFSDPKFLGLTIVLGTVGWFAEAYAFYLVLGWMGSDISLATAAGIFVFSVMVGGLTGAPGGVGGTDAALVALLTLEGVPLHISLAATAIIRITTLWFAISIGLIVFPVAERYSKKAAHALENN
ncbi:MAG: hypothetical protein COB40_08620 [Marinosulfonomonas sp.]|nr:MAG: hypothetical protein COB40_08620 [Marinosulfonomonas sp.]